MSRATTTSTGSASEQHQRTGRRTEAQKPRGGSRTTGRRPSSWIEEELELQLRAAGVRPWVREHRILAKRKFRWDFAWPELKVAVEVQGGTHMRHGAHNTHHAIVRDCEKRNYATIHGWRVLEFVAEDVEKGWALSWIEELIRRADPKAYAVPPGSTSA